MAVHLTENAIAAVNGGDVNLKPLVQVLDLKAIGDSQGRHRITISDGVSTQQALLATQLNERVKSGRLRKGSVVQLIEYICSTVQNRKIIVILNMETIVENSDVIGHPKLSSQCESIPQKTLCENSEHLVRESSGQPSASFDLARTKHNISSDSGTSTQLFHQTVQPSYCPPPNYKNHGAIIKNEAPARIIPIAALNPYQGRWAIKARVTAKGDLRRYNNARGDGKVFSFDILDVDGGEIRVTCFNAVVDRFYDAIKVGKVYLIAKGSLKPAKKDFNHLKNEWEIFLESASTVELLPDEDDLIPKQRFSFRHISEIENIENNSIVDIIGIVISINPPVTVLRKNGMETQRRILNLKDESGKSVEVTLWGDFCSKEGWELQEIIDSGSHPVLAIKTGKVSDFSGKSIGTISATQLFINPDFPEVKRLQDWFDRGGKSSSSQSISREVVPGGQWHELRKTVSQIKGEGLGQSDKPDWITVKAIITYVKTDNFCYTACPLMVGDRKCGKKVKKSGSGNWHCDRCDQELGECDYRFLLQLQIQDHTGITWITAFQEAGEEILGYSAKDLYFLKYEEQDDVKFGEIIRGILFEQYLFRLKIKEEVYGDEQRVKVTVVKAERVNFSAESAYLLDFLSRSSL